MMPNPPQFPALTDPHALREAMARAGQHVEVQVFRDGDGNADFALIAVRGLNQTAAVIEVAEIIADDDSRALRGK